MNPKDHMVELTKSAILLFDHPVHLLLTENGVNFEEVCAGVVLGYDEDGLLIQQQQKKLHFAWKGIRKIERCPGKETHKEA